MNSASAPSGSDDDNWGISQEKMYSVALLRSLKYAGIKFLRYMIVDMCNNVRCKAVPIDHLLREDGISDGVVLSSSLDHQVSIAIASCAGVPFDQDVVVLESGIDAKQVLPVKPDLLTLRPLPYSPKTALVLGTLHDQYSGSISDLCTRGLLKRVIQDLGANYDLECSVGAELEFCLYDAKTNQPVDNSLFANSTTLNEQEEFISDLYDQLRRQHIRIELIHAEAGPGQIELVLAYQNDAMALVDNIVLTRETIVAVSHKYGFKALFLPKYDMTKAGNGLHLHLSLYQKSTKRPVFSEPTSISLLTKEAESFLEGILLRTCALTALTLPSSNSFLRVGKGCWTGSSVGWAVEDKESGIRLCSDLSSKKITNMEFKYCDAKANLYLALAGILRAGMDGLERKLKLRPSLDDNNGHHGEPLPENFPDALEQLKQDEVLLSMMGSKLGKAYLAVRSSEAERSKDIPLEEEVIQWLGRA